MIIVESAFELSGLCKRLGVIVLQHVLHVHVQYICMFVQACRYIAHTSMHSSSYAPLQLLQLQIVPRFCTQVCKTPVAVLRSTSGCISQCAQLITYNALLFWTSLQLRCCTACRSNMCQCEQPLQVHCLQPLPSIPWPLIPVPWPLGPACKVQIPDTWAPAVTPKVMPLMPLNIAQSLHHPPQYRACNELML